MSVISNWSVIHTYPSYNVVSSKEKTLSLKKNEQQPPPFHSIKKNAIRRNLFQALMTGLLLPGVYLLPTDMASALVLGYK